MRPLPHAFFWFRNRELLSVSHNPTVVYFFKKRSVRAGSGHSNGITCLVFCLMAAKAAAV